MPCKIVKVIWKNLFAGSRANHINKPKKIFTSYDSSDIFYGPKDVNSKNFFLFICDFVMTNKKQDITGNFCTRGRHNNCSCIYISQNYHKLPRQTIRTNCNILLFYLKVLKKI